MRRVGRFMRTDDRPGGIPRRGLGVIMAVMILVFTAGVVSVAVSINSKAQLSQVEVTQLRSDLAGRKAQRDAEREQVQARLDTQAKAFCAALAAFRDADQPANEVRLKAAERAIGCATLERYGTLEPAAPATPAVLPGAQG